MPKKCSVCTNETQRVSVEALRAEGVTYRDIEERLGIPHTIAHKHMQDCVGGGREKRGGRKATVKATRQSMTGYKKGRGVPPDLSDPSSLLAFVRDLAVRTNGVLADAERSGHRSAAVAAARESRAFAQLLLELEGAYGKYARPSGDIEAAKAQAVIAECLQELTLVEKREWLHGLTCPDCIRWQEECARNGA